MLRRKDSGICRPDVIVRCSDRDRSAGIEITLEGEVEGDSSPEGDNTMRISRNNFNIRITDHQPLENMRGYCEVFGQ